MCRSLGSSSAAANGAKVLYEDSVCCNPGTHLYGGKVVNELFVVYVILRLN